ncbi:MAG: FAD-dependent oxidoreductase [Patescibacteria group bacterium]
MTFDTSLTRNRENTLVFKGVRSIAEKSYEIAFEKPDEFQYLAGQSMKFLIDTEKRSLSCASAPHEKELLFAFRNTGSKEKEWLLNLKEGERVQALGPRGDFIFPEVGEAPLVFLAGGIGIAPFFSMLKHADYIHSTRRIHTVYTNRTLPFVAYRTELNILTKQNPSFSISYILTQENQEAFEQGRIDAERILLLAREFPNGLFFAAGAPAFVDDMHAHLINAGVSKEHIHSRHFTGYEEHTALEA